MNRKIIIVDKNPMTGEIEERFMLEGDYEQLGDFFKALKRMCLGIGYTPENVEDYFGDCENWAERDKWDDSWKQWSKRHKKMGGEEDGESTNSPPPWVEKESCGT